MYRLRVSRCPAVQVPNSQLHGKLTRHCLRGSSDTRKGVFIRQSKVDKLVLPSSSSCVRTLQQQLAIMLATNRAGVPNGSFRRISVRKA